MIETDLLQQLIEEIKMSNKIKALEMLCSAGIFYTSDNQELRQMMKEDILKYLSWGE